MILANIDSVVCGRFLNSSGRPWRFLPRGVTTLGRPHGRPLHFKANSAINRFPARRSGIRVSDEARIDCAVATSSACRELTLYPVQISAFQLPVIGPKAIFRRIAAVAPTCAGVILRRHKQDKSRSDHQTRGQFGHHVFLRLATAVALHRKVLPPRASTIQARRELVTRQSAKCSSAH